MIIILSAPSGCGKTSLAKKLKSLDSNIVLSTSVTTRKPRANEIEGVNYFFRTIEEFKSMDLLESAEIYGNWYGTPRQYVESQLNDGKDVLFDIDSQGAYQIMSKTDAKIISIFILPPSLDALRMRLQERGQDSQEDINLRLVEADREQEHALNYQYNVINDDFDQAVKEIQTIISFERLKSTN